MQGQTLTAKTYSQSQTESLAQIIGSNLRGGECIELVADLGGGKTTFTRGLVKGAGSDDHVASPTFTISKIYDAPHFEIHHFDFYRLSTPGLIAHELTDVIDDSKVVIIVEWGEVVNKVLPKHRMTITISVIDEESREITIQFPKEYSYMLQGVTA